MDKDSTPLGEYYSAKVEAKRGVLAHWGDVKKGSIVSYCKGWWTPSGSFSTALVTFDNGLTNSSVSAGYIWVFTKGASEEQKQIEFENTMELLRITGWIAEGVELEDNHRRKN